MKKNFLMMLALMLTTSLTMMADNDRVINFEQLPAQGSGPIEAVFWRQSGTDCHRRLRRLQSDVSEW